MWSLYSLRSRKEMVDPTSKKRKNSEIDYFSMRRILREEGRSNEIFEAMISQLNLEELISLKLELAVISSGGRFEGFPLWSSLRDLTKDAFLRFALSVCRSKPQVAAFLGMTVDDLRSKLSFWDIKVNERSLHKVPKYIVPIKILLHERYGKQKLEEVKINSVVTENKHYDRLRQSLKKLEEMDEVEAGDPFESPLLRWDGSRSSDK